jgi:fluoride exporter
MMSLIYIGMGGFFGAMARYLITLWSKRTFRSKFPIGTLGINLLGSFLLGVLASAKGPLALLLGTGFMGAFTTFSTFKLETLQFHLNKEWRIALPYLGISYLGGIGLALFGFHIASLLR